ncbi:MAG: bifunctional DedA family/phosphatase PAP2 family protein [Pseudomonadota bacterium]
MGDLIQQLVAWVGQYPGWAAAVVFVVAFVESLAVAGVLVPGVVMMFGAGALIGAGAVGFWPLYAAAVVGAVAGDGLSFWLGRRYREQLRNLWPFRRHPASLERGMAFFARYGGKSVALGRFFGPVRAIIPLVAGMMDMTAARFAVANVLSAIAWAVAYLAPGMLFGASLELASEVAFHLVALALGLVMGLWLLGWISHRLFTASQPLAARLVETLLNWPSWRPRWSGRIAAALADPDHPEARGLAMFAALLVLTSLFSVMLVALVGGGESPLIPVDRAVHAGLSALRAPVADHLMVFVTTLGDAWFLGLLVVTVTVLLWLRDRRGAWHWLAAAAFAFAVPPLLKALLRIPRPELMDHLSPWAFPSAHTLRATVIYGFLAVLASTDLRPAWRWPFYSTAVLIVALVAFSRVYLGVHWLSDVVGAVLLGVPWVAALGIGYRHHRHAAVSGRPLLAALAAVAVVGLGGHAVHRQAVEVELFRPAEVVRSAQLSAWREGRLELPRNREDALAGRYQALYLQYAGDPGWLAARLREQDWETAQSLRWDNALKLLVPSLPLAELPLLPHVHGGQHEVLALVRDLPEGKREVLRFWPGQLRLQPGNLPLWLGSLTRVEKMVVLGMLAYPRTLPGDNGPGSTATWPADALVPAVEGTTTGAFPVRLLQPGVSTNWDHP